MRASKTVSEKIEIKVGPESQPGTVTISSFISELLTLSVTYKGERSSTVSLTRDQARQLRRALARLETSSEKPSRDLKLAA